MPPALAEAPESGDPQPAVPIAPSRAAFAFVFVTVALDMVALGVMIPVLPRLIESFRGGDVGSAARINGLFAFTWAAMQFVFAPVLGAASDRFGRRPVILLSNLGLGLDYLVMAAAPSLSWLFIGRLVSGITSASFSTASAYVADVTPPEKRAARFGMLGAAFGLGFIIGPAIGGLAGGVSLRLPFWISAVLSIANACYGLFILPESLPREKRRQSGWRIANPLASLSVLRTHPVLVGLSAATLLGNLAHESLPSVFVLYADYRYHWREREVGGVLAAVGVCSTIVAALLTGPAVSKLGERRALLIGLAFGALSFAVYGGAASGGVFLVGIPLMAIWGIAGPATQALMSQRVDDSAQGELQGAIASLHGVTGMLGPLLFSYVFAISIDPMRETRIPGAPYLLAAGLVVLSTFVAARVVREKA